jgi:hypothetical protein
VATRQRRRLTSPVEQLAAFFDRLTPEGRDVALSAAFDAILAA